MRVVIWPVVLLVACANTVNQNAKTGPDGRIEGAKKIEVVDQVLVKDIVTYPGGDRVDWKELELPAGKSGKLDLEMTYTTPRPGLKITFDVFDDKQRPIKLAFEKGRKKQSTRIDDAVGKYFVRVYAPKRGDAATYKLTAKFEEVKKEPPIDYGKLNLPNPPSLPDVVATRPCDQHDPNNDACNDVCAPGANRKKHPPCIAEDKAEQERIKNEQERLRCDPLIAQWNQAVAQAKLNVPQGFTRRLTSREQKGSYVELLIPAGQNDKIDMTWTAKLVRPDGTLLPGGTLQLTKVNVASTTARTTTGLTLDDVTGTSVKFEPSSKAVTLPPKPFGCEKFMP